MWITDPQAGTANAPVPIVRATGQRPVRVALRGEPRRLFVHFAAGRTWPCTVVHCSLCRASVPRRLYCYYPAYDQHLRPCILELTAQAEAQLLTSMSPHTSEPRGVVQVSRSAHRRNSPVLVEWSEPPEKHATLADALSTEELERALLRIWGLPVRNGEVDDDEWLRRLAATIELRTSSKKGGQRQTELPV